MEQLPSRDLAVTLLSVSFLPGMIVGAIAGRFGGMMLGAGLGALVISGMSLTAAWIEWNGIGRPTDLDVLRQDTLLLVFLLFGCVPFAMSLVMLTTAWEDRPGATHVPPQRSSAVLRICSWGRVLANLTFLSGFVVAFWEADLASMGKGFPLIGAGALVHAVIGVVAGLRLSAVFTYLVVAAGFIGFGFFAQSVGL